MRSACFKQDCHVCHTWLLRHFCSKNKSLACISLDIAFALGTQRDQKQDKQHEIYMPNANPALAYPTPPIFHLLALGVGIVGNTNFSVCVGGNANFSVLDTNMLVSLFVSGISNTKFSQWGLQTRTPNTRDFALQ